MTFARRIVEIRKERFKFEDTGGLFDFLGGLSLLLSMVSVTRLTGWNGSRNRPYFSGAIVIGGDAEGVSVSLVI